MPAEPSSPPSSASKALAWVLLAVALVGGYLLVRRPAEPPPRPEPGDLLLSETLPLAPVSRRIRIRMPCTVRVDVGLPPGVAVTARLGPPLPSVKPAEGATEAPDQPIPEGATWTIVLQARNCH